MKNRFACLFLTLVLACGPLPTGLALGEELPGNLFGSLLMDTSDAVFSAIPWENQLLVLTRKAFYTCRRGESRARYLCPANDVNQSYPDGRPAVNALFANEGRLMGLNSITGQLYRVIPNEAGVELIFERQLPWEQTRAGEPPYDYPSEAEFVLVHHGRLYMKFLSYGQPADLYSFDLATGEWRAHNVTCLHAMTPYQDGLFLAVHYDQDTSQTGFAEIVLFDPAQDTMEATDYSFPQANAYEQTPLYYDEEADLLYTAHASVIYVLQPGQAPIPADYFVSDSMGVTVTPMLQPLPWGGIMLITASNIFPRSLWSGQARELVTLRVSGFLPDSATVTKALLEMGNVVLEDAPYMEDSQLQAGLLTGSLQADILVLDSSQVDIKNLVQKRYVKSLSASEEIAAFAENLLPELKNLVMHQNEVWALPVSVSVSLPAVNLTAFEELEEAPPAGLPELIALTQRYATDIYPERPEMILFPFAYVKEHLKRFACQVYLDTRMAQGDDPVLSGTDLAALVNAIDALDLGDLNLPEHVNPDEESYYMLGMNESAVLLMELEREYRLSQLASEHLTPTLLRLKAGVPVSVHGAASLITVPASSAQGEKALAFIQAYLKHMDPADAAMLCPSAAVPVEDPQYEQNLQEAAELVTLHRQMAEQAEGADRRFYNEMADEFQEQLDRLTARGRYRVTQDHLTLNAALMDQVFFDTAATLTMREVVFSSGLVDQLLDGVLTAEQFVGEINQKEKMVILEMQ